MRVLSCNLFSGRARSEAVVDVIERERVDVVCAQELTSELASAILEVLPFGAMKHDQTHRGTGIASRWPISTARIRMPMRDAWAATLSPTDWPGLGAIMDVISVHVSGPHVFPYYPNPVRRRLQVDALFASRQKSPGRAHAILGDFNSSPVWPVYKRMRSHYSDAVLSAQEPAAKVTPTWPNLPAIGLKGMLRIDHCFTTGLNVRSTRRIDIQGSDHFGLLVDIDESAVGKALKDG